MQQWYKCPKCGKDIPYGTNPCTFCKFPLAWSQQGPILYVPPFEAPQKQVVQSADRLQSAKKKTNPLVIILAIIIGGCILLFGTCAICIGNSNTKSTPAIIVPPKLIVPEEPTKLIGNWSGDGIKTTPIFSVNNPWKIEWEYTCGDYGIIQIYIYDPDGNLVDLAANVANKSAQDTSYVHKSGEYYLKINSFGGNWRVSVYSN